MDIKNNDVTIMDKMYTYGFHYFLLKIANENLCNVKIRGEIFIDIKITNQYIQ